MTPTAFHVEPEFAAPLARVGIVDAASVWSCPAVAVWRSITERENGVIQATREDGSPLRLHVKRDKRRVRSPAADEAKGMSLLRRLHVPVATLVAFGQRADGASFVITEDLAGHSPADKLLEGGVDFDRILSPTAVLAGSLHRFNAFHRDLYLCHFMTKADGTDARLIDCARVMRNPLLSRRWRVKDLAQFVYSTRVHPVSAGQIDQWLTTYGAAAGKPVDARLRRAIARKVDWIARHDARLKSRQPGRDVSIPR